MKQVENHWCTELYRKRSVMMNWLTPSWRLRTSIHAVGKLKTRKRGWCGSGQSKGLENQENWQCEFLSEKLTGSRPEKSLCFSSSPRPEKANVPALAVSHELSPLTQPFRSIQTSDCCLRPTHIRQSNLLYLDYGLNVNLIQPLLVWLSWLGVILQTKRSQFQFPVRAHAWVVGSVPSRGTCKRQPINVSPSLPLSL